MSARNDVQRFLAALFDECPPRLRFLIWTLPNRRSQWYRPTDIDKAVESIVEHDELDTYVGVGLSSRDRGARQRCSAREVAGIVGLWADLDIADDVAHTKANLPPDEEAARALASAMGVEPTVLLHSGHGLQAWWLFDEPWVFSDDDERARAAALANRWNLTLRVRAAEQGYVVDSTQDLSRVLRVPGTVNRKAAPVPVRLLSLANKRRYGPSDLEQYLVDDSALTLLAGRRTYSPGELVLDASAQPPFDKFHAMLDNDTKFRQSWERKRKDLPDNSASSYDLSLATIVAEADWTDQEIVDLLVASRRKHGDDLKLRQDYYARTVSKARDSRLRERGTDEIDSAAANVERMELVGDQRGAQRARKDLLDHISSILNVEIVRFVRYLSDPPRYRMETTNAAVTIGDTTDLMSQHKMRAAIAGATRIVVPRFKGPKWDSITAAILAACEDEDTGIEATEEGIAYSWLTEYLQDRPVLNDRNTAVQTSSPFEDENGVLHIFGTPFRRWLWLNRGDRASATRMGEVLRAFGCDHVVVNVQIEGRRTTRSAWQVPGLEETLDRSRQQRAAQTAAAPPPVKPPEAKGE